MGRLIFTEVLFNVLCDFLECYILCLCTLQAGSVFSVYHFCGNFSSLREFTFIIIVSFSDTFINFVCVHCLLLLGVSFLFVLRQDNSLQILPYVSRKIDQKVLFTFLSLSFLISKVITNIFSC